MPWLLLAAFLVAPGGPPPGTLAAAVLATTVAVLLAPGTLLLLLAGVVAAAFTGDLLRWMPDAGRRVVAVVAALVFGAVSFLLGRWDPQPGTGAGWAVPEPAALGTAVVLLAVGALAAWRLPRFRVAALALVATTAAAVILPGGRSTLHLCLPLGALLTAALLQSVGSRFPAGERVRRLAPAAAAFALAGAAVTAVVVLVRAPHPDLGAGDQAALVSWAGTQLRPDARLVAPVRPWAELVHAGGDENQFRLPGTAGRGSALAPVLSVTDDGAPDEHLVAVFDRSASAPPLAVLDPARRPPSPVDVERRRALVAALLANPTTTAGDQATRALESGQVDPRLLTLLAALAAQFGVGLDSLPPAPGESLRHTPVRQAVADMLMGRPLTRGEPLTDRLVTYLDVQRPPFAPDRVEVSRDGVHIAYHYVSAPDALVSGSTP